MSRSPVETHAQPPTRWRRLGHELREYAGISLYLFICFAAILLYKAAILGAQGPGYVHFGLAAAKALILAKFMLLGHAIRLGERHRPKPLVYLALYESILFLAWLAVLTVLEEAIVGFVHGRTLVQSLSEIAGGEWLQIAAICALMWLILLPYFGFRLIGDALGEARMRQLLFGRP